VADTLVQIIRAREIANGHATHSIFVGGDGWNSGPGLIGLTPLNDPDIIYTFHNYDPYFFTHQGMSWTSPPNFPPRTFPQAGEVADINNLFASVKAWSVNYSVPVSLGEYGCSTAADATSRCNWIQTLANAYNAQGFSHFYWDAISPTDAFGFYAGGVISQATVIPCFKNALGLYASAPVELETLTLKCQNRAVFLEWVANASSDAIRFDIQSSRDGINWTTIGSKNALEGRFNYGFDDPANSRYYRLIVIDEDGTETYSNALAASCGFKSSVEMSPNPASTYVTLRYADDASPFKEVSLYDVSGRLLWHQDLSSLGEDMYPMIPVYQFPAATYIVTALHNDGTRWQGRLVKY
jgi:hypothetical protein